MFVLAELKDIIRIPPDQFKLQFNDAVSIEINNKLANKVILNVGLGIGLKDIVALKESILLPLDGASHTEVIFRYIVFRPPLGYVLTGKIRSCSREGVHVTLGFFDDIIIPPMALQHPSRFDDVEQAWVWEYPLENGEKHDLFMDVGEPIKFRVVHEIFEESSPIGPQVNDLTAKLPDQKAPYKIIGVINESGLGVLSWWHQQIDPPAEEANNENNENYENDEDGEGACEE